MLKGGKRRPLYLIHNAALRLVFKRASRVLATSQEEFRQIVRFGVPSSKIVLIPNYVEASELNHLPPKGIFRDRYGLDQQAKIVLFVGRLTRIKGLELLVEAFADVISKRPDVWLVLVGPDGGAYKIVLDLAKRLGCSKRIITPGALYGIDKLEAFVDADFVVMPSFYESFGIVALEAFGCGKPVVGSRVGGLKELIVPDQNGLLFERGDREGLTSTLTTLLDNPDLSTEMGLNARELVLREFTDKVVGSRLLSLCDTVMRDGKSQGPSNS